MVVKTHCCWCCQVSALFSFSSEYFFLVLPVGRITLVCVCSAFYWNGANEWKVPKTNLFWLMTKPFSFRESNMVPFGGGDTLAEQDFLQDLLFSIGASPAKVVSSLSSVAFLEFHPNLYPQIKTFTTKWYIFFTKKPGYSILLNLDSCNFSYLLNVLFKYYEAFPDYLFQSPMFFFSIASRLKILKMSRKLNEISLCTYFSF